MIFWLAQTVVKNAWAGVSLFRGWYNIFVVATYQKGIQTQQPPQPSPEPHHHPQQSTPPHSPWPHCFIVHQFYFLWTFIKSLLYEGMMRCTQIVHLCFKIVMSLVWWDADPKFYQNCNYNYLPLLFSSLPLLLKICMYESKSVYQICNILHQYKFQSSLITTTASNPNFLGHHNINNCNISSTLSLQASLNQKTHH